MLLPPFFALAGFLNIDFWPSFIIITGIILMIRRRLRKADSMDRSFLSDSYSARWLSYHPLKCLDCFSSSSFYQVFCIEKSCAEFLFKCHKTLLWSFHILCNHFWWSWLALSGALHESITSFHSAQCQNAHNSHNKPRKRIGKRNNSIQHLSYDGAYPRCPC